MGWKRGNPGCCSCGPPGGTVTIAGCTCTAIPTTLYLRPNDPIWNGGMFKDCTLVWGTVDPGYSKLALGSNAFISTESFVDQIGQTYQYYFTCTSDKFTITRIYISSIFGTPYRDSVRYTWPIASAGNTCSPFYLTTGTVYQGGDTRSDLEVKPTSGPYTGT